MPSMARGSSEQRGHKCPPAMGMPQRSQYGGLSLGRDSLHRGHRKLSQSPQPMHRGGNRRSAVALFSCSVLAIL